MTEAVRWSVEAYATRTGERPALPFLESLEGRSQAEAIALVKLLEERGSALRRPQSAALGAGLFELRGREIRIFYTFLSGRVAVLLDGTVKKRKDVPARVLERVRGYQREIAHGSRSGGREGVR
jgi:hypothetical protein